MARLHIDNQRDPEVLLVRAGTLVSTLAGVFFIGVAAIAIISSFLGFTGPSAPHRVYAPISGIIGLLCAFVGLYQVTSESGHVIDRRTGVITAWSSVFGRRREAAPRSVTDFDRIAHVRYFQFNRVSDVKSNHRFRIELRSNRDVPPVRLAMGLRMDEARSHAQRISEFLALPIEETKAVAEGIISG